MYGQCCLSSSENVLITLYIKLGFAPLGKITQSVMTINRITDICRNNRNALNTLQKLTNGGISLDLDTYL